MRILSIGKTFELKNLDIVSITHAKLSSIKDITSYEYLIISGGDGSIRRVLNALNTSDKIPKIILNPTGSFNVIAKKHRVPKVEKILNMLAHNHVPKTNTQKMYMLNKEIFLFSAGNMGDLQHIFLSESLRFGLIENGVLKYILAILFLLPLHLIMTPFMLFSSKRFFIFTPASFIPNFARFYGKVEDVSLDLGNDYNLIELDGDIVTIQENILHIRPIGNFQVVTKQTFKQ